jgi:hypothetical protein
MVKNDFKEFELLPGEGLGPIKLGMKRDEVRALLPVKFEALSVGNADRYYESLTIGHDKKNYVERICVTGKIPIPILYNGLNVFVEEAEVIINEMSKLAGFEFPDYDEDLVFVYKDINVELNRRFTGKLNAIVLFTDKYYDVKIKKNINCKRQKDEPAIKTTSKTTTNPTTTEDFIALLRKFSLLRGKNECKVENLIPQIKKLKDPKPFIDLFFEYCEKESESPSFVISPKYKYFIFSFWKLGLGDRIVELIKKIPNSNTTYLLESFIVQVPKAEKVIRRKYFTILQEIYNSDILNEEDRKNVRIGLNTITKFNPVE